MYIVTFYHAKNFPFSCYLATKCSVNFVIWELFDTYLKPKIKRLIVDSEELVIKILKLRDSSLFRRISDKLSKLELEVNPMEPWIICISLLTKCRKICSKHKGNTPGNTELILKTTYQLIKNTNQQVGR